MKAAWRNSTARGGGNGAQPTAASRNIPRTGNAFVCGSAAESDAATNVIAFNRFQSEVVAKAIGTLATALKAASGGNLLVLAFHGYTYTIADSRLIEFGHLRANALIDHPHLDGWSNINT